MTVFSFVTALVSPSVVSNVESTTQEHPKDFFERLIKQCGGLTFTFAGEDMCQIQGDWHSLVNIHDILEKMEESGAVSSGNVSCDDAMDLSLTTNLETVNPGNVMESDCDNVSDPQPGSFRIKELIEPDDMMPNIRSGENSDTDNSMDLNEWHGVFDGNKEEKIVHNDPPFLVKEEPKDEASEEFEEEEYEEDSDSSAVVNDKGEEVYEDVDEHFPEGEKHDESFMEDVNSMIMVIKIEGSDLTEYSCQLCGYKQIGEGRRERKLLRRHVRRKHMEKNHTCPDCGKAFGLYKDMKRHIRLHSACYNCEVCGKQFKYERSLNKHLQSHEVTEMNGIGEENGTADLASEDGCEQEQTLLDGVTEEQQTAEDLNFAENIGSLIKVYPMSDPEQGSVFACRLCEYQNVGKDSNMLREHIGRMHMEKKHICNVCSKGYGLYRDLKRHIRTHSASYPCNQCGKIFKQMRGLRAHELTHDEECVLKQYPCELCGEMFRDKYTCQQHIDTVHKGLSNKKLCTICGQLVEKNSFKEHQAIHFQDRPYQCDVCNGSYKTEARLRAHKKMHTSKDSQFKCTHCGKVMKSAGSLRVHTMTHSEEARHVCPICHKAFKQHSHLIRHSRIHTGERPFACEVCTKTFSDTSVLRRHVINVHKLNFSMREHCRRLDPKNKKRSTRDIKQSLKDPQIDPLLPQGSVYNTSPGINHVM